MSTALEERQAGRAGTAAAGRPRSNDRQRRNDRRWKAVTILGVATLVGFIAWAVLHSPSPVHRHFPATKPSALAAGSRAPGFTLARLGGGPPVSLATAHGKPAMVNFFASWCTECRKELHAVAAASAAASGRVATIAIDTNDPEPATAERLLERAGARFPVGIDRHHALADRFDIEGLPVTFFLDGHDTVVGVAFGPQTERSLLGRLAKLTSKGTAP